MYKTTKAQRRRVSSQYIKMRNDPVKWDKAKERAREMYKKRTEGLIDKRFRYRQNSIDYDRHTHALAFVDDIVKPILKPRQCEFCSLLFTPENQWQNYCDNNCEIDANKRVIIIREDVYKNY